MNCDSLHSGTVTPVLLRATNRIHLLIIHKQRQQQTKPFTNKTMPRSFLVKKKEKLPRWERTDAEIVTPRTVFAPTPSRLEQLAAIVTGSPLHYLPTYPVSAYTPLAVSLANGKFSLLLNRAMKIQLLPKFLPLRFLKLGRETFFLNPPPKRPPLLVLTSAHLMQINHCHICS